jgi:drug/metabolite transporter, DME family
VNPRIQLLTAAFLFSTGGAAIKSTTWNSWQVAGARSLIAALFLAAFLPQARAIFNFRVLVAGLTYALTLITFVSSTKLTTAANAVFLQATAPIYLTLLSPLLLKERTRRAEWLTLAVILPGMALLFLAEGPPQVTAPNPVLGNLLALASGIFWALTIVSLRWLNHHHIDGLTAALSGNIQVAILCALPAFLLPHNSTLDPQNLLPILYLGCFQVGFAYMLLTRAVRHLSAMETSLLVMLEPALNPVWTFLLHNERPAPLALAGGILILGATLAKSILKSHDDVLN